MKHNIILQIYWKVRQFIIYIPKRLGFLNLRAYHVWGEKKRLHIGKKVSLTNAIINTRSGDVYIGDYVFLGHNVMVLTGWHDYTKKGPERLYTAPQQKEIYIFTMEYGLVQG